MTARAARKPLSTIKPVRLELWIDGAMVARAGIVTIDNSLPELVMLNGIPFLRDVALGERGYRKVKPYCIAAGD